MQTTKTITILILTQIIKEVDSVLIKLVKMPLTKAPTQIQTQITTVRYETIKTIQIQAQIIKKVASSTKIGNQIQIMIIETDSILTKTVKTSDIKETTMLVLMQMAKYLDSKEIAAQISTWRTETTKT